MTEHYPKRFILGKVVKKIDFLSFLFMKSKNYILLKIIFKFEHLTINKYLCNTTTRCTLLPVEIRWDLDASYDWLPKWKCLSTHESLYLKVPVIRLRSFLWVSKSATIFGRKIITLTIQNFRRVIQANRATSNTIQLDRYNFY